MAVPGKQLEPAARQGVGENFLLLGGDAALVAAEQQHRRFDAGEKGSQINRLETVLQGGCRRVGGEPVAEGLPAPRAGAMGSDRRSGILLVEGVDPADLVGNTR